MDARRHWSLGELDKVVALDELGRRMQAAAPGSAGCVKINDQRNKLKYTVESWLEQCVGAQREAMSWLEQCAGARREATLSSRQPRKQVLRPAPAVAPAMPTTNATASVTAG